MFTQSLSISIALWPSTFSFFCNRLKSNLCFYFSEEGIQQDVVTYSFHVNSRVHVELIVVATITSDMYKILISEEQ